MSSRVKKLLIPLAILIVAILLARVLLGTREDLQTKKVEPILPVVSTVTVQLAEVPVTIVAHGNARSRFELDLASEVTGRVEWVADNFEPGERVTEGELLLKVDATGYRVAVAEARAALATADNALADAIALKRKASESEARLNIEATKLRIARAERDLAYTDIRAPFNSVIDQQRVELGQFINTGQVVAHLLSSDTVEVTLPIPAADTGFLDPTPGTPVQLLANIGGRQREWQGQVLRIQARVDSETRVIPVVVQVEAPYDTSLHEHQLTLGLFTEVRIPGIPVADAVRLPKSVLQPDDTVFVMVDEVLQRRSVEVVRRAGDTVVISGGLSNGDQVVVTNLDIMFEGMKVRGAR